LITTYINKKEIVMKKLVLFLSVLTLTLGQVSAQAGSHGMTTKLLPSTQAVMNSVVNDPDLMVITGRIRDAETQLPITDAKINFDKFGDELVNAAIDKDGNYALAINKKEVGEQIRVIFKIEGYQRYTAKAVRCDKPFVDLDLSLWPEDSKQTSTANMKYTLSDDPFNTLVIKF
jgi:hypothetical protein